MEFGLYLWGGVVSFLLCAGIAVTQKWHGHLTLDSHAGVQKFHVTPTPRVGGVGIYAGLVAAWLSANGPLAQLIGQLLMAALPAFLVGLLEDVTKRVGVRERLLATMLSGVIACYLSGVSITKVGIWGMDELLAWLPFSVLFTVFAVAGVANAVNIIDGFNGLAAGTVIIALVAMGMIAFDAGDQVLAEFCFVVAVVTLGFMLINFPFGKIFMGDGGAYFLGFLLAWVAVLLPARNPSVSAWASLLACAYPVLEVLFSVARRRYRAHSPGHPDRLHLHSLIKSRLIRKKLAHWPASLRNSAVSPLCWGFPALSGLIAYWAASEKHLLMLAFVGLALLYRLKYRRLIYFRSGL